jgi:hypothetical protein
MVPLILLLVLSALVAACPPLFNDFTYLGNDTHTTADLVRDLYEQLGPQQGWDEIATKVRTRLVMHISTILTSIVDWLCSADMARRCHPVLLRPA